MKILLTLIVIASFGISTNKTINLQHPVKSNQTIVSEFGLKTHPILQTERMHTGVDYAVQTGTEVFAAEKGKISFSGIMGDQGNTIIIDHENGFQTKYSHLSSIQEEVIIGKEVDINTKIAESGSSGVVNKEHLHFEVLLDGEAVDPKKYLSID